MTLKPAAKIAIIYLIIASLWIYLSDTFMAWLFRFDSIENQMTFSVIKGVGYVIVTSFMLYKLIKAFYKQLEDRMIKLQESELQYRTIVETANEGVWQIDGNKITTFVNEQMAKMLGYTVDDMVGKNALDFLSEEDKVFSQNIPLQNFEINSPARTYRIKKSDGQYLWVELKISRMSYANGNYAGAIAMATDITERKEAQDKILVALNRYNMISQATRDTIWEWDIENHTVQYNQGIFEVFGYVKENINSDINWFKNNIHPNDLHRIEELYKDAFLLQKKAITTEYRFKSVDKKYKYIKDRSHIEYNENGKPLRLISAMQDVTLEHEANMQIEKAVIDTQEKEKFMIGMELHDNVNQLLSGSVIYLGLLNDNITVNEKTTDLVNKVDRYIHEAIQEIRKLSHQLAPVSGFDLTLKEIFQELIDMINANNQFKVNLYVEPIDKTQFSPNLQISLYRVLQEQLNNIVKYAEASEVNIRFQKQNEYLQLTVADNGKGFDKNIKSTGIGIENIKRRAKLFSGELIINTSPGKGCELKVEIPIDKVRFNK